MKKLFLTVILLMSILTALTGCGGGTTPPASFSIDESLVPGTDNFPTGVDDSSQCSTVTYPYYMAKYEVTYALWKEVYDWAIKKGYTIENPGNRGAGIDNDARIDVFFDTGHESDPVTNINWYDAIVWCNALTEYYNAKNGKNLDCVYKNSTGNVIKNSIDSTIISYLDNKNDFNISAKGFRLPTSMEWELAARYKDGSNWTPGNYASGATDYAWNIGTSQPNTNLAPTQEVAWYWDNCKVSSSPDIYSTHPVGQKLANTLGLYDMSGNVWEWCSDLNTEFSTRVYRGGGWNSYEEFDLLVGVERNSFPGSSQYGAGFRPVRTK
ncbi:MAG TPA: SUMF1/EgtB/PvdO family nonheme iron enzyme [Bacillota bacterium]|nr:SUMF1/EgtB/PvdO family nonheme iron enzyme [Bacillota bacterium]